MLEISGPRWARREMQIHASDLAVVVEHDQRESRRTVIRLILGIAEQTFQHRYAAARQNSLRRHDDALVEIPLDLLLQVMPARVVRLPDQSICKSSACASK